jgi:hypothetical protein
LRAVEYGEVTRIGASKPLSVDVRIVAATNENLPSQVEKGKTLPHELICPLHSPTVGVKAHELARYFGCFPSKNRALWRIIGQSAGLAQDLYSE